MSKDLEPNVESQSTTRRAALGMTAAMTAGLLAEKALSPDSAHAEGVSSVNGKTGAVTLPGLTSEGNLPTSVVISSTDPLTISGAPTAGEVLTATSGTAADWQMGGLPVFNTANYASIQEAIEKAEVAGGGTVYVPVGTHEVSAAIKLGSNVNLMGEGMTSVIKLKAGSKTPILETLHFGEGEKNAHGFSIRRLTFDGNKTNCPEGKCGIQLDGFNFVVEDVTVRNAKEEGILTKQGTEVGEEEISADSIFINVRSHGHGENGFTVNGPLSTVFVKCLAYANGYCGFRVSAASYYVGCRAWANTEYGFYVNVGDVMFVNCVAEESSGACLHITNTGHVMWVGGEISNTNWEMGTSPLVSFLGKPEGVQFVGTLFTRTETVGEGPCINLTELGEGYRFTGVINHEHTSKAIEGTWPENGEVDLVVYGKTSTKSIRRLGGGWSAGTLGTHAIQKTGALAVGARSAGLGTQLRGQIEAEKEITAASTIWTLPEGLRPSSALELPALLNTTMVVVKISTAGVVTCSVAMKEKEVLKLDGLTFDLA